MRLDPAFLFLLLCVHPVVGECDEQAYRDQSAYTEYDVQGHFSLLLNRQNGLLERQIRVCKGHLVDWLGS